MVKFIKNLLTLFSDRAKAKRLQEAEVEKIKMAALGRMPGAAHLYMGFYPSLMNEAMHLL